MRKRSGRSIAVGLGFNVYLELTTQYQRSESRKVAAHDYLMAPASGAANIAATLKILDKNSSIDCHVFFITGPKEPKRYPLGAKLAEGLMCEMKKKNIILHPYALRKQLPISNNIIEHDRRGQILYERGIVYRPKYKINKKGAKNIAEDVYKELAGQDSWLVLASLTPDDVVLSRTILQHVKIAKKVVILSGDLIKSQDHKLREARNKIIESADYLIQNEEEAKLLLGKRESEHLIKDLQSVTKKNVVITLAEKGAIAQTDTKQFLCQPAFRVKAVDSTGVGDAFIGGFVYACCMGKDFQEALRWGAACGAVQATKLGGQPKITRKEVEKMLKKKRVIYGSN